MTAHAPTHVSSGVVFNNGFVRVRALPVRQSLKPTDLSLAAPLASLRPSAGKGDGAKLLDRISEKRSEANAHTPSAAKQRQGLEFKLIYLVAFAVFLLTAAFERVVPMKSRSEGAANGVAKKSVLQEAREAASISAAYAFMG
ncbi:MAG: hypothetical protein NW216_10430 [Hyphomicrobium sp.]|nr:hypothetical protein [Hyphomicrobium sp.]